MRHDSLVVHIDPAIGSNNLGDEIISQAVSAQLRRAFPGARILAIGSRDVGKWSRALIRSADLVMLGGTNALSSSPVFGYRQFAVGFLEHLGLRNVVLLGVGWWQYQDGFGPFARAMYARMLRGDVRHAVRDGYTLDKMRRLGFDNALNTGCPTMWSLSGFDTVVTDSVVVTLTDYNRDPTRDVSLLKAVTRKFRRIRFWPQGIEDVRYLKSLSSVADIGRVEILNPDLQALDRSFEEHPCYAGTRLHAGIRALQHQCPAYIVPIDNRATELARTASLTLTDPELASLEPGTRFRFEHENRAEVKQFMDQFR